ncbi:hypothetical protein D3C71_909310 [compost metagenome]
MIIPAIPQNNANGVLSFLKLLGYVRHDIQCASVKSSIHWIQTMVANALAINGKFI